MGINRLKYFNSARTNIQYSLPGKVYTVLHLFNGGLMYLFLFTTDQIIY